jgi:hypothetical protein
VGSRPSAYGGSAVLMPLPADNPVALGRNAAFLQGLQ